MKRTGKNILMIVLCLLLAGAMVFTVFFARSRMNRHMGFRTQMPQGGFGEQMADGEMPQMPEGGFDGQRPDGEMPQMPNDAQPSDGQPPAWNGGMESAQGGNMPNQPFDPSQIPEGEMPQMPDGGFDGQRPDGEMPQMPEGGFDGQRPEVRSNMRGSLSIFFYLILGAQALMFSLLLLYLLLSGFNKRSFRETFHAPLRIVAFILCVLVLTAGLTLGGGRLARPSRMPEGFVSPGGMGHFSTNEIAEDAELTTQR